MSQKHEVKSKLVKEDLEDRSVAEQLFLNALTNPKDVVGFTKTGGGVYSNSPQRWGIGPYGIVIGDQSGSNDQVKVSFDRGRNFANRTLPGLAAQWVCVAYGNSTFVALNDDSLAISANRVATSTTQGDTWTGRALGNNGDEWRNVKFGGGVFIAIGRGAGITGFPSARSTNNGVNWTQITTADNTTDWRELAFGNGVFLATGVAGTTRHMRSTDLGASWSAFTPPTGVTGTIGRPTYGNSRWIAPGGRTNGGVKSIAISDDDGVTWVNHEPFPGNTDYGLGNLSFIEPNSAFPLGIWVAATGDLDFPATDDAREDLAYSLDNGITWKVVKHTGASSFDSGLGIERTNPLDFVVMRGRLIGSIGGIDDTTNRLVRESLKLPFETNT